MRARKTHEKIQCDLAPQLIVGVWYFRAMQAYELSLTPTGGVLNTGSITYVVPTSESFLSSRFLMTALHTTALRTRPLLFSAAHQQLKPSRDVPT